MEKKRENRIFAVIIAVCAAALSILYVAGMQEPDDVPDYKKRFTFISPLTWSNVASGVIQADRENGTNTRFLGTAQMDIYRQAKVFRQELLSRPDGIITSAPVDTADFRDALSEAASLGIPVVLVDSDLSDSDRSCYIGTDNPKSGYLAGEEMIKATGGFANIAIVTSDKNYPSQNERIQAFKEAIADFPEMKVAAILDCHSERLEVLSKLPAALREQPQIDALYLTEAIASITVGDLLKERFPGRRMTVVATDNLAATKAFVADGTYICTIAQNPWMEGYLAGKALVDILAGKEVADIIFTDTYCVTKDNLEETTALKAEEIEWVYY